MVRARAGHQLSFDHNLRPLKLVLILDRTRRIPEEHPMDPLCPTTFLLSWNLSVAIIRMEKVRANIGPLPDTAPGPEVKMPTLA